MHRIFRLFLGTVASAVLAACGGAGDNTVAQGASSRLLAATTAVSSSFGVTAASGSLTVDSGAGLVFRLRQTDGNITSIRLNGGPELQVQNSFSQIQSGLGTATTVSHTVSGGVAKITLTTPTLIHYLLVREGENNIYMGTYTTTQPANGELRWVTRLYPQYFTALPPESIVAGAVGRVGEEDDVYLMADGTTRSKYYGNQAGKDLSIRGITGPGTGVFMAYGNRETASGGPFFRDIQNQSGIPEAGNAGVTHVYNYMNSSHVHTDTLRTGFHGPYALLFNDGSTIPAVPDMQWMESQNLTGWVPASARGKVTGQGLLGFNLASKFTVGFSNTTAQYWATAKAPNGSFTVPAMKPGTYTMTVYKDELDIYTETVSVTSGTTTTLPVRTLTGDPAKATALWRIGVWDGTPLEFMNGPALNVRHPSDVRNAGWGPVTYTVGDPFNTFPAAQWVRNTNNPTTVKFNLTAAQMGSRTIRIGIPIGSKGGRPQIRVNAWNSANPASSFQPVSRNLTLGTYRGNNAIYSFAVPASAFVQGTNTLTINAISGSAGVGFLSPAIAFDAIDML